MIPPKAKAAFVAAMEDILAVYTRPHDPDPPLVCLDETSKQLVAETRAPIPTKAGRSARFDYENARNGTANLFMLFAPLEGWRHVKVTDAMRPWIMPPSSKSWLMCISPLPRRSSSFKTISASTVARDKQDENAATIRMRMAGGLRGANDGCGRPAKEELTGPAHSRAGPTLQADCDVDAGLVRCCCEFLRFSHAASVDQTVRLPRWRRAAS